MKQEIYKPDYKKLIWSILFDLLGLISFTVPGIGEYEDVVWAPVAYWLMTRLYPGSIGKISGVITFIEEAFPGTDFIPTFTLTWLYEHFFVNPKKISSKKQFRPK